jgi:signal peptidase
MEPAFYRGDLLFLTNPSSEQYKTGDITVYKIPGADIPIVHRVLETHDVPPKIDIRQYTKATKRSKSQPTSGKNSEQDNQLLLTKGDNNPIDDIELYRGLEWLEKKHIVGKVKGCVQAFHFGTLEANSSAHPHRFLPYVGYVTIAMVSHPSPDTTGLVIYISLERLPSTQVRSARWLGPTCSHTARVNESTVGCIAMGCGKRHIVTLYHHVIYLGAVIPETKPCRCTDKAGQGDRVFKRAAGQLLRMSTFQTPSKSQTFINSVAGI